MATIDVLIPTYRRQTALAVTLTSLSCQTSRDFRIVVSDQTAEDRASSAELQAILGVLRFHGHDVSILRHVPRRGLAEQRQFLLDQAAAPYCLFLDDDVILEPDVVARLRTAMEQQRCGFVGMGMIGLSHVDDERPHEQAIEFWEGPVQPESVLPQSPAWQRHRLHSAANLLHVQHRLNVTPDRPRCYRVAWVGGCVLYDVAKLRAAGGFSFWRALPPDHCGEDVLAQLLVMARYGGCGLLPSGVYHQQLPTTVPDRRINAPLFFFAQLTEAA
ncbi:MAG TPA: glycosyltransferase family 2 protein [Nitrospira sp.]|nr:glycosyltransferase family 2 protein [Nitrospira sp.]